ncbi:MAG: non-heme iron oxygenase ferredoxin subunit [Candidatus Rokubacteria bacterium]|nr:non-heme iron oxygenase ferredoxin subunit [Candidatus Rokubacteria bacterium]
MGKLVKAAEKAELNPGEGKVVELEGKTLAIFNVDGAYYAIDNTCLHRGGPLGEGELEGTVVTCPWHGWRYDVGSGANVNNPAVKVTCFPVKVEGTSIFVEI